MHISVHKPIQTTASPREISKTCIFTIYLFVGIIPWIIFWTFARAAFCPLLFYSNLFYVPSAIGIGILAANLIIWLRYPTCEDYPTEAKSIGFVERNASRVVIATSVVFLAGQAFPGEIELPHAFTYYSVFALISSVIALVLIWMPSKKVRWLVTLRHIKTVSFSYAVSFFIAALMSWLLI